LEWFIKNKFSNCFSTFSSGRTLIFHSLLDFWQLFLCRLWEIKTFIDLRFAYKLIALLRGDFFFQLFNWFLIFFCDYFF
jgi:hypothetical protein